MKANELRIGNHLYDSRLKVVKIECLMSDRYVSWDGRDSNLEFSFQSDDINMYHPEPSELCPIPLTAEILTEWCGFKSDHPAYYYIFIEDDVFQVYYNNSGLHLYGVKYRYEYLTEIKYLHQLQNLYFALTGQELEVKLPTSHRKV